jgi:hypothetical protein
MAKNILVVLVLGAVSMLMSACSPGEGFVANKRDAEFYGQFVNPNSEWPQAESRLSELKVLETNEVYQMRYALFANGAVYYQIDKLGNGNGRWKYEDGALTVTASRPIFDMELTFSAAEATGDQMTVRFVDRHGLNSASVLFRNPGSMSIKDLKVKKLKEFTSADKNI